MFTTIQGSWSVVASFRNSMAAPKNVRTPSGGSGAVFAWDPKVGAAHYKVQVSTQQDFAGPLVEHITVDSPTYAPLVKNAVYKRGGSMYWRVAAVDDSGNVGEVTKALLFKLPMALRISASGRSARASPGKMTITVTDPGRKGVRGVKVTITGGGLRKTTTTKSNGKTPALKLRPRKREKVTITVSRAGYKTTTPTRPWSAYPRAAPGVDVAGRRLCASGGLLIGRVPVWMGSSAIRRVEDEAFRRLR